MVEAIFSGMLASGLIKKENVYVADISDSRLDFLVETYGIQAVRKTPVIRIMPNTPMLVQEGAAGVALGKNASEKDGRITLEIFNSVGNAYSPRVTDRSADQRKRLWTGLCSHVYPVFG